MVFRYNYTEEELEYYEKLNRCTIGNDYVLFETDEGIYKVGFHELVRYINDYYDNIIPFDNMKDVAEIYDISEIIDDMIRKSEIEDYCEQLDSF